MQMPFYEKEEKVRVSIKTKASSIKSLSSATLRTLRSYYWLSASSVSLQNLWCYLGQSYCSFLSWLVSASDWKVAMIISFLQIRKLWEWARGRTVTEIQAFSKVCVPSSMSLTGVMDVPRRVMMCALLWKGRKGSKLSTVYHPNRGYRYVEMEDWKERNESLYKQLL